MLAASIAGCFLTCCEPICHVVPVSSSTLNISIRFEESALYIRGPRLLRRIIREGQHSAANC
jgi:hypothetical protein